MKKSLLIATIILALTACSNTQSTTKITEKEDIYFKGKKAYTVVDDSLFSGITRQKDSYGSYIEIIKFENGNISSYKRIEDGSLIEKLNFSKKGKLEGSFYLKEYGEIYEGTIDSNLFTGIIKDYDYYDEDSTDYSSFANGLLHGKMVEDGVESYYNKGMLVSDQSMVEEVKAIKIPTEMISSDIVTFDGRNVKVDNKETYSGWIELKDYDEVTYFIVENNLIVEERTYYKELLEDSEYLNEVEIFSPTSIVIYNEDGSSNITSYSFYNVPGKFDSYKELDKDGNIDGKVIEIDYDGRKTVKTQKGNTLIGETYIYDTDGSILEIHSYNDEGYTLLAYYDYENKSVRVEGQGQKIDNDYYRTGNWKWYYEDGTLEYEADFNYDEQYSYVKNFYLNGNIKSEGKMDYCACTYIDELKEYNEDGSLNTTTLYDDEGNLVEQKINENE